MASAPLEQAEAAATPEPANVAACPDGIILGGWREAQDQQLLSDWQELEAAASEPNPFYCSWGLLPALQSFDPFGPVRLLRFYQGGRLCGLLPLAERQSYYGYPIPHLAGWMHDNAFCGAPLVRRGDERAFWRALLSNLPASGGSSLFLHLIHVPSDGPLFEALTDVLEATGAPGAVVQQTDRAMLQSDFTPEAYFEAAMSGKKRKELRRQHKRLSEEGDLAFVRQEDGAGLGSWTEEFLTLELAGWKGREGSALASDPRTERVFRDVLAGGAQAGKLERLALRFDGKPIAMLANFLTPPGAFSFKTAFDENFARYSPGVLLQRENLDLLARGDIAWADSCAAADHPMIERIWREKRTMLRLSIGIGGTLRQTLFRQLLRLERGSRMIGA